MIKVFKDITDTIVSGLNNGTVKDSLPTGITSTDFGNATQFELNDQKQFHKDVKTETVDGKEVTTYTYTKTYTVKIDPKTVKTEKVDGVDYAPLNGETTLTVGSGADAKEIPFPIPAGKVTFPQTTYTLNYDLNGGDANTLITQQTATTAEEKHTFTIHNVTPTREGYTFAGWTESQTPTAEDTRYQPNHRIELTKANNTKTLYAQWTPATNTGYTVEHYLQKLEGDGYTKQETEELTGTTGENVNAAPKSYTGFTCDEKVEGTIKSGTIAADGSLVLKLYYTRNSYTVTYTDGVDGAEVFADDEHNNVAYGSTIPAFKDGTPTRADYNFTGWTSSVTGVTTSSTMPDSNVTFTAGWAPKNKATINYEVVGPANCGRVTPVNEEVFVDAEKASGSTATAEPNYRFVGWYSDETCTTAVPAAWVDSDNKLTPGKPEGGWVTTTYYAKFVPSTVTFDLNTLITKKFEAAADSKPIPDGNYTFTAQIFEADDTWQQVGERPVYTGTATLNGAASGAAFDFDSSSNPTLASGTHRYLVKEEHGGETIDGITYDSTVYRLTITVSEDGTQPNVQIEAEPQASVLSVQSVAFDKTITFTNTYFEKKDPSKLYIDFSDFVQKELTATGTKTASDVNFTVDVKEFKTVISSIQGEEEVNTYAGEQLLSTTLTAHFDSITGGETKTAPFNGSIVVEHAGTYSFELTEEDGQRTGVTYDDSTYKVYVYVKREGDKLVVGSFNIYKDGWSVAGETITFHNTIDTGKDDYYPIIIPTIINKDTGMLNKTDHFAYVIGYPDGTVHPNGQITRAEVATIFFRLLRDEVRDGAFTTSNSYSDVAYGKWYNNPISTMSALGIITGYPDGTFKPNKPITRAEFAAIAARFDETQSGKSATFSDVIGHWAAKEIGIAYYNDWIKGYPDGTFKPDQNITRAEAMTMINRVLERKPESPADLLTNMNKWTDNLDTSKWYYLDVQEATNSHGYTRKTFNYELWRQMLNDPDWSRYER